MSSVVPEGWSRQKLGDSLIPRPKSKLPSGESNPLGYYDFYVCSHKVLKSFHNEYSSPSILFSTGGEASVHLATERYAFSTDVWATEFEGEICNEYVFRLLEENIRTINYSGFQGSGIKHLDKSFIEKLEFSIPPLPEQKKIASILTSVDEVIENTQKQIDKLQDLKKATMNELLTKGIGHTEFKDSELGRIPKSWEVRTIGDIVNPKRPVTYGIVQAGEHVPDGIPYIRVSDMKSNSLHPAKMMRTSPVIAEKFMRSRVLEGDIVYALRGDVGKVLVVPRILEGANLTQGTALISKSDSIETFFLYWCFDSSATRKQTYDMAKGSTFVEMTLGNLKNIKIPVPPCIEQSAIAKILDSIEGTISLKVEKFHQTQSLKKSLMQDLLTGKVRVAVN